MVSAFDKAKQELAESEKAREAAQKNKPRTVTADFPTKKLAAKFAKGGLVKKGKGRKKYI